MATFSNLIDFRKCISFKVRCGELFARIDKIEPQVWYKRLLLRCRFCSAAIHPPVNRPRICRDDFSVYFLSKLNGQRCFTACRRPNNKDNQLHLKPPAMLCEIVDDEIRTGDTFACQSTRLFFTTPV